MSCTRWAGKLRPMRAHAQLSTAAEVLPLRVRFREEMHCQVVHDSIHSRPNWTLTYLLEIGGVAAGFGSIAVDGPWKGQPTVFEFYVEPASRTQAFALFEALLEASGAQQMEIQSNDTLLSVMFYAYARNFASEKIVFRDGVATELRSGGA